MSSSNTPNGLQAQWAQLLIASLVDAGIKDIVLSPGSRSTPFVLAALEETGLRCHDIVDERSAAFFALGQARVSGRPSLLLCTSGTAAANYLPAVVEACAAYVPLLVLSADRPQELRGCGANQTIDQVKLFGDHVRWFADLGTADEATLSLRALRRSAAQAVFATLHPQPGAVHLNAPARKPLEPPPQGTADPKLARRVDELRRQGVSRVTRPRLVPPAAAVDDLAKLLRSVEHGVIVCGPAPLAQSEAYDALVDLAQATGYPVLADAASQFRFRGPRPEGTLFIDSFPFLLGDEGFRRDHRPELIVQIGRAPTTSAWEHYVELASRHWVLGPYGWNDPTSTATDLLVADIAETLTALLTTLDSHPSAPRSDEWSRSEWSRSWRRADQRLGQLQGDDLAATTVLTESGVAREVVDALPENGLLVVGNSLPIRQVDAWVPGGKKALDVASQRGASGIDGVLSGACGAAGVKPGATVLLIGDISFLHDLSGLATARGLQQPLAIVVVQNRGGRIFEMLPLASLGEVQETKKIEHWTTPHTADFAAAAAVHGLRHLQVTERAALCGALREALAVGAGATVIEAVVEPHGAVAQNRRLAAQISAEISLKPEAI